MKPPKCKVCGREHYGPCFVRSDALIVDDPGYRPTAAKKLRAAIAPRLAADVSAIVVRSRIADDKPKRGRPISDKPKSPRAEYQRELMRKRRSKK